MVHADVEKPGLIIGADVKEVSQPGIVFCDKSSVISVLVKADSRL
jgi:hypothetical protein